MNVPAAVTALTDHALTVPLAILYVTAGCNLRCITCSYREPLPGELTIEEYRGLSVQLRDLGLRRIVYSGGEPLLRRDLPDICRVFQNGRVKQSLLTNGLLLEKRLSDFEGMFNEIIVSLDGPDRTTHNFIRGIECYDQIIRGIEKVLATRDRPSVGLRYVIQRRNFRKINEMILFAASLGVDRISFLAADVQSGAFHRDQVGAVAPKEDIMLNSDEAAEFRSLMSGLLQDRRKEFETGFVSETPAKMMHMVSYFEAVQGESGFPRTICNAPSVSMVITSTGEILPCYFLPAYANIRSTPIRDVLNSEGICSTRRDVRAYRLPQCQHCVCTLKVSPIRALQDDF